MEDGPQPSRSARLEMECHHQAGSLCDRGPREEVLDPCSDRKQHYVDAASTKDEPLSSGGHSECHQNNSVDDLSKRTDLERQDHVKEVETQDPGKEVNAPVSLPDIHAQAIQEKEPAALSSVLVPPNQLGTLDAQGEVNPPLSRPVLDAQGLQKKDSDQPIGRPGLDLQNQTETLDAQYTMEQVNPSVSHPDLDAQGLQVKDSNHLIGHPDLDLQNQTGTVNEQEPAEEAIASVCRPDLDTQALQKKDSDQPMGRPDLDLQTQSDTIDAQDTVEEANPPVSHPVLDALDLQEEEQPRSCSELSVDDNRGDQGNASSHSERQNSQMVSPRVQIAREEEPRLASVRTDSQTQVESIETNSPGQNRSSSSGQSSASDTLVWVTQGLTEHPAFLLTPLESGTDVKIRWLTGQGTIESVPASCVRMDPGWDEGRRLSTRSSARGSRPKVMSPGRFAGNKRKVAPEMDHPITRSSARGSQPKVVTPTLGHRMLAKRRSYVLRGHEKKATKISAAEDCAARPRRPKKTDKRKPHLVYCSEDSEDESFHQYWEVERVLDRKVKEGVETFLVKWAGVDEITWEPEEHLCESVLAEAKAMFQDRNADTKRKENGGGKRKKEEGDASADRKVKKRNEKTGPNLVYLSEDSEDESVHQYWEVERVLDRKVQKGVEKFLIKWAGVDEITWEPEEHLCDSVLKDAREKFNEDQEKDNGNVVCVDFEHGGYCSDDSEEEVVYWEVDRILKRKTVKQEEFFLVKWKGEGNKPTWEPADNLCDTAIEEARQRFCANDKDDDIPFTLTTTRHVIENFNEIPNIPEGKVLWRNEPTPETSVNFAYLLASEAEKKKPSRKWPARKKPRVLELFAGIGGMSLGWLAADAFETKWLVEKNSLAALRQKLLHPDAQVYEEDVGAFLEKVAAASAGYPCAEQVDHVHASPPCQGFSRANRYGGNQSENNKLCFSFIRAVKLLKPITATLENVEGMFQTKHLGFLQRIIEKLIMLDYHVRISVLDSSTYGDPQKRKRVFLFASSKEWPLPLIPKATHGIREGLHPLVTVRDALSDLELISAENGSGLIFSKEKELVYNHQITEPLSSEIDPDERLDPDKPCGTILTGSRQVHYKLDRVLSVREVARLMSFPDDFQLFGSNTEQYAQLGNAVPVKLATAVARSVASTYGK